MSLHQPPRMAAVDIVDPEEIEAIVGVHRMPHTHMGRIVQQGEDYRLYVLHSEHCLNTTRDLRLCDYSRALERWEISDWTGPDGVVDTAHPWPLLIDCGRVIPVDWIELREVIKHLLYKPEETS